MKEFMRQDANNAIEDSKRYNPAICKKSCRCPIATCPQRQYGVIRKQIYLPEGILWR